MILHASTQTFDNIAEPLQARYKTLQSDCVHRAGLAGGIEVGQDGLDAFVHGYFLPHCFTSHPDLKLELEVLPLKVALNFVPIRATESCPSGFLRVPSHIESRLCENTYQVRNQVSGMEVLPEEHLSFEAKSLQFPVQRREQRQKQCAPFFGVTRNLAVPAITETMASMQFHQRYRTPILQRLQQSEKGAVIFCLLGLSSDQ